VSQPLSCGVAIAFPNSESISRTFRRVEPADGSTAGAMELAAGRAVNSFENSVKGVHKFSAGRGELGAARETPSRTNHFEADSMRIGFRWVEKSQAVCPTYAIVCRSNGTKTSPRTGKPKESSQFEKIKTRQFAGLPAPVRLADWQELRLARPASLAPLWIANLVRNPD